MALLVQTTSPAANYTFEITTKQMDLFALLFAVSTTSDLCVCHPSNVLLQRRASTLGESHVEARFATFTAADQLTTFPELYRRTVASLVGSYSNLTQPDFIFSEAAQNVLAVIPICALPTLRFSNRTKLWI